MCFQKITSVPNLNNLPAQGPVQSLVSCGAPSGTPVPPSIQITVAACLVRNGLTQATAIGDAADPNAHGSLLDSCRANPSFQPVAHSVPAQTPGSSTSSRTVPAISGYCEPDFNLFHPDAVMCYITDGGQAVAHKEFAHQAEGEAWISAFMETHPNGVTLATPPGGAPSVSTCPPPVTGTITTGGNRIPLTVRIGSEVISAILDSGAARTTLPTSVLEAAGFTPYGTSEISGVVAGATTAVHLFKIDASDILVEDGDDVYVPIAYGMLYVVGVDNTGGVDNLIGPDVLKLGATLTTTGKEWTLQPGC